MYLLDSNTNVSSNYSAWVVFLACVFLLIARVLLVDYSPPFDPDTCEYLHDALVNFFSLVTHLSGPCRTPFFGLFALTSYFEVSRLCFKIYTF